MNARAMDNFKSRVETFFLKTLLACILFLLFLIYSFVFSCIYYLDQRRFLKSISIAYKSAR